VARSGPLHYGTDPEQVRDFKIISSKTLPGTPPLGKGACLCGGYLPAPEIVLRDEPAYAHIVRREGIGPVQPTEDGKLRGPSPDTPDLYEFINDNLCIRLLPETFHIKISVKDAP
jgi:hypothetical protein